MPDPVMWPSRLETNYMPPTRQEANPSVRLFTAAEAARVREYMQVGMQWYDTDAYIACHSLADILNPPNQQTLAQRLLQKGMYLVLESTRRFLSVLFPFANTANGQTVQYLSMATVEPVDTSIPVATVLPLEDLVDSTENELPTATDVIPEATEPVIISEPIPTADVARPPSLFSFDSCSVQ